MSASNDKSAKPDVHGSGAFPASTSLVGIYEPLFRILEQASSGYVLLDAQEPCPALERWLPSAIPLAEAGLKGGSITSDCAAGCSFCSTFVCKRGKQTIPQRKYSLPH